MTGDQLQELDLGLLLGLTTGEAKSLLVRHGGYRRAAPPGGAFTADYRPTRVTVTVEHDRVTAVHGIG